MKFLHRDRQILREINFEDFRSTKVAFSTHLEALNFDFHEFFQFVKAEIDKKPKFRVSKIAKRAFLKLLGSQKISCKI